MPPFDSQEFMQDYRTEVSDHIKSIGENLLALEETLKPDATDNLVVHRAVYLEELLRSFHTIKGLSSMVGLEHAADLSHTVESILRLMITTEAELDLPVIDRLLKVQNMLQSMVNNLFDAGKNSDLQTEMAAVSEELKGIYSISDHPGASKPISYPAPKAGTPAPLPIPLPAVLEDSLKDVDRSKVYSSLMAGQRLGIAMFLPSTEKSARGVSVNEVRQRLQDEGNLIKAVPSIESNKVSFIFLVALPADVSPPLEDTLEWNFPMTEQSTGMPVSHSISRAAAVEQPGITQRVAPSISSGALSTVVRINQALLDNIVQMVSELVVSNSRLENIVPRLKGAPAPVLDSLSQTVNELDRKLRMLRRASMATRMVPLSEAFSAMPLAVRDLARSYGKELHLEIEGENTQIDRLLVERLLEPLLHLVRNAITHGIETPDQRQAAGKPRAGRLRIAGQPHGEWVEITVEDDGRGLDLNAIAAEARKRNLLNGDEEITTIEALDFICQPGFTTKAEASLGAGRGIGMDVVARSVRALHGSLSLQTRPGAYTRFILSLPLTLTIMKAILVGCSGERYAIPQTSIDEVIEIDPFQIVEVESGQLYPYAGESIALVHLDDIFHLGGKRNGSESTKDGRGTPRLLYGLVSGEPESRLALVVDKLLGLKEVVVRTIPDPLVAQPSIAGATELGDGSLVLIVDIVALLAIYRQGRK